MTTASHLRGSSKYTTYTMYSLTPDSLLGIYRQSTNLKASLSLEGAFLENLSTIDNRQIYNLPYHWMAIQTCDQHDHYHYEQSGRTGRTAPGGTSSGETPPANDRSFIR